MLRYTKYSGKEDGRYDVWKHKIWGDMRYRKIRDVLRYDILSDRMKDKIKVVIRDLVIHKLRRVMRSGMIRNAGIYEIVG